MERRIDKGREYLRTGITLMAIGIIGQIFGPIFVHSYFRYHEKKIAKERNTKIMKIANLEERAGDLKHKLGELFDSNRDKILDINEMSTYAKANPDKEGIQGYREFEIKVYNPEANKLKKQLPQEYYKPSYLNWCTKDEIRQVGNKVCFSENKAKELLRYIRTGP